MLLVQIHSNNKKAILVSFPAHRYENLALKLVRHGSDGASSWILQLGIVVFH